MPKHSPFSPQRKARNSSSQTSRRRTPSVHRRGEKAPDTNNKRSRSPVREAKGSRKSSDRASERQHRSRGQAKSPRREKERPKQRTPPRGDERSKKVACEHCHGIYRESGMQQHQWLSHQCLTAQCFRKLPLSRQNSQGWKEAAMTARDIKDFREKYHAEAGYSQSRCPRTPPRELRLRSRARSSRRDRGAEEPWEDDFQSARAPRRNYEDCWEEDTWHGHRGGNWGHDWQDTSGGDSRWVHAADSRGQSSWVSWSHDASGGTEAKSSWLPSETWCHDPSAGDTEAKRSESQQGGGKRHIVINITG